MCTFRCSRSHNEKGGRSEVVLRISGHINQPVREAVFQPLQFGVAAGAPQQTLPLPEQVAGALSSSTGSYWGRRLQSSQRSMATTDWDI
jgi:hypothetical protein